MKTITYDLEFDVFYEKDSDDEQNSIEQKPKSPKRTCKFCHKSLSTIGQKRSNGKVNRYDGDNRNYHIKCYKAYNKNSYYDTINDLLINGSLYDVIDNNKNI